VDHISGGKAVTAGDFCLTGQTAAKVPAFLQKFRAGSGMDGTVHTASSQQGGIGRVDDGIAVHFCNIVSDNLQRHGSILSGFWFYFTGKFPFWQGINSFQSVKDSSYERCCYFGDREL
jgi:hypothetical protein